MNVAYDSPPRVGHATGGGIVSTPLEEFPPASCVAEAFGYTDQELAGVPEGANLGLSCGNPIALARLREVAMSMPASCSLANIQKAESVIDLGSGAGLDVFTAAKRVGPNGKAIGVDMNKNMIDKANAITSHTNARNVQFIESAITSIALPDNTADWIISNCVINLVPAEDKQLVFDEMFRLLKPGGRVAISDILARKEFTEHVKKSMALYVGCVAGASQVNEYNTLLKNAGFSGEPDFLTEIGARLITLYQIF
ncbi:hypothetical protein F66182_7817 [Fusarium sp. NRRL 66182]|nr:hypothetical protein F66182_7817 [Fusarium sp. NRRL 66182]